LNPGAVTAVTTRLVAAVASHLLRSGDKHNTGPRLGSNPPTSLLVSASAFMMTRLNFALVHALAQSVASLLVLTSRLSRYALASDSTLRGPKMDRSMYQSGLASV
jgi:hypothetical protein